MVQATLNDIDHLPDDDVVESYPEAAKALNISVPTLRRQVARGAITATAVSDRRRGILRRHRREYAARRTLRSASK